MLVHNNTTFSEADIDKFPVLGTTVNNWRGRKIELREHPHDANRVISIGTTFDGKVKVIADEPKSDWAVALEYASRGKVYVSH